MRTNQFTDLKRTILGVQFGNSRNLSESVEYVQQPQTSNLDPELVEYVTNVIYATEQALGINMTAQEIHETSNFIVGKLGTEALIESIEEQVGFELNENEVAYVLNTLNESL